MDTVEVKVNEEIISLSGCPPNKEHMSCFLTGEEIDQRAVCSYCWLHFKLESDHPDARYGRLRRSVCV